MGSRAYEMAFRLNARLGNSYNGTFAKAENIAKKTFGSIAKLGAAVLGGIGIADMANTYKDFQQSIANTGAVAGVPKASKEFKALENAALEAGKQTTKTATEAADALGYMSLAGWTSEQSISGLMPVLRLSEASGADLAATSDLVTDSMSAMGLSVDQLSKYLDVAAQANNKTNQTATQLMEAYIGVGGKFKGLNTPMAESAAVLGVLANRGIKGSEAGNSLTSVLANLTKKGGESAEAMKALGVSAFKSNGEFKGITNVVAEISGKLKGLTKEQETMYIQMIGGKTQETAFRALLSGYETFTEGGKRELIELQEEMENSSGSLDKMAEAMNDTLGGALAILGSASDDMKIQIMKEIEPTVTPIIRSIADALPGLSAKVAGFVKSMVKKGKVLWSDLKPVFNWIVNNFDKIKIGIAAVGGAFVTAKIVSKIKNAATAIKGLTAAASGNPFILFIEGIIGIGAALQTTWEQAKKTNFENHFGDIALSAEQIDRVAKQIVKGGNLEKLQAQLGKFDVLGEIKEKTKTSLEEIEKFNWKVSVGLDLSLDEQERYKAGIDEYIADSREYFEQAFQADWGLFEGNAEVQAATKKFYEGVSKQLYDKGVEIKEALNKGLQDTVLDLNEAAEIARLVQESENIKAGLAQSEYETKMGSLKLEAQEKADLNGGSLKKEDYDEIVKEAQETAETLNAAARDKYSAQENNLARVYGKGTAEYEKNLKIIDQEYQSTRAMANTGIVDFMTNTVESVYDKELRQARTNKTMAVQRAAENLESKKKLLVDLPGEAMNYFGVSSVDLSNMKELRNGTVGNINNLRKYQEELAIIKDEYISKQKQVPQYLTDTINAINKSLEGVNNIDDILFPNIQSLYKEVGLKAEPTKKNQKIIEEMYDPSDSASWLNMIYVGFDEQKRKRTDKLREKYYIPYDKPPEHSKIAEDHNGKKKYTPFINWGEGIENLFKNPIEANLTVNAKTALNQQTLNGSVNNNKNEVQTKVDEFSRSKWNASLLVEAKTDLDKQAFDDSANAAKKEAQNRISAIFNKFTVNGKLNVGLALSGAVTGTMNILSSTVNVGGKTKGYAAGTEYTPDTFIAGEKGAELITGAKGRKVFTALETGNIFANMGRIKDTFVSAVSAVNVFDKLKGCSVSEILGENEGMSPERIVKPSNTANNNSSVSVTINNEIKIDGTDTKNTDNLKDLINKAMKENGGELADMIMDIINQNNARKVRLSNE